MYIRRLCFAALLLVARSGDADERLVNHWTFDGTLDDAVGGNHAIFTATEAEAPTYVEGHDGTERGAIRFNGRDFVVVKRTIGSAMTIACWVRLDEKQPATGSADGFYMGAGLVQGERDSETNDAGLSVLGTVPAWGCGSPDRTIVGTKSIITGRWVHIAAARELDQAKGTEHLCLYVNGTLEAEVEHPFTGPLDAHNTFEIGGHIREDRLLKGDMGDVRFYNQALQDDEIRGLAVPKSAVAPPPEPESAVPAPAEPPPAAKSLDVSPPRVVRLLDGRIEVTAEIFGAAPPRTVRFEITNGQGPALKAAVAGDDAIAQRSNFATAHWRLQNVLPPNDYVVSATATGAAGATGAARAAFTIARELNEDGQSVLPTALTVSILWLLAALVLYGIIRATRFLAALRRRNDPDWAATIGTPEVVPAGHDGRRRLKVELLLEEVARETATAGPPSLETEDRAGTWIDRVQIAFNGTRQESLDDLTVTLRNLQAGDRLSVAFAGMPIAPTGGSEPKRATRPPRIYTPTGGVTPSAEAQQESPILGIVCDGESEVTVVDVLPGSPADRAGLAAGDVIIEAQGGPVTSYEALKELLRGQKRGQELTLVVARPSGGTERLTVPFVTP